MEPNTYNLILKNRAYPIPSDFLSINDIDPDILFLLKTEKQYIIHSNVSSEILQLFIEHWTNNDIPKITPENLYQFEQLSQEFDRMTDLIQIFKNLSSTNTISSLLLTKKYKKIASTNLLNATSDMLSEKYQNIIQILFTSPVLYNKSLLFDIKTDLLAACKQKNLKMIDALLTNKTVVNGYSLILNKEDKTATIYKNLNKNENIFVPKSIIVNSEEYFITNIYEKSFHKSPTIKSIQFSEDSEIQLIDKEAFSYSSVESISIPPSLSTIRERSFSSCSKLKSVTFSEDSEECSIESYAFSNTAIESIFICTKSLKIDQFAFQTCSKLKKVEISSNQCIINSFAFAYSSVETISISSKKIELQENWASGLNKLYNVIISPDNDEYCSYYDDQYLLKKSNLNNDNYDVLVYASKKIINAKIPPFIRRIDSYSFAASNVQKVEFSEDSKLETIGKAAFCNSRLQRIVIPSNVSSIGEEAFYSCRKLTSIEFSDNQSKLKVIENATFSNCRIKSITIPSTVTRINPYAFSYCEGLKTINLPENSQLKSINGFSFIDSSIENLIIPSKVTDLYENWCSNTQYLNNVSIVPNNSFYSYLDNSFIIGKSSNNQFKNKNVFDILLFARRNIKNIVKIPSFIKRIAPFAFNKCHQIKRIEFSNSSELQSIENNSFELVFIENIKIPSKVVFIGNEAFLSCVKLNFIDFSNESELILIDDNAFCRSALKCFCVPPKVKMIGYHAFEFCNNLQIIEMNDLCGFFKKNIFKVNDACIIMIPVNKNHDLFINCY